MVHYEQAVTATVIVRQSGSRQDYKSEIVVCKCNMIHNKLNINFLVSKSIDGQLVGNCIKFQTVIFIITLYSMIFSNHMDHRSKCLQ